MNMTFICIFLPIADVGDCSDGVTITVIGMLDVPPDDTILIGTCLDGSTALTYLDKKLTLIAIKYRVMHICMNI